ncbi:MAG: hypothetical protein QNJ40_04760 [Xanthomonadales bacterium]|nr:hypothetical protein [Xanthomonadales bacterium]
MEITNNRSPLFFNAIGFNAVFAGGCGLLMVVAAQPVAGWLGVDAVLTVASIGAFLLLFAARLVMLRRNQRADVAEAWSIVMGDLGWVVFSLGLLSVYSSEFSDLGRLLIAATAVVVMALAVAQAAGIRPVTSN